MARPGLTQHRKFLRLGRLLGCVPLALGCLELLWEKCYQNGDPYLGDEIDIEAACQWNGEPGKLTKALLDAGGEGNAGFIERSPDKPGYQCHDLFDHAPRFVGTRLQREMARVERGQTLSQIRSEAGRKGGSSSKRTASERSVAVQSEANEQQTYSTPAPAPALSTTTTPPTPPPSAGGMLPLEVEPPKERKPAKPRGRDFTIGALDLPEDLVAAFDKTWRGYPSKGWNFSTKSEAPRRINRELALTRFAEIVRFNHVEKADGSRLTAEELADATLAWVGKRIREARGEPPCVPCIGNFFSSVQGEKHPWKDAILEFFQLEGVS